MRISLVYIVEVQGQVEVCEETAFVLWGLKWTKSGIRSLGLCWR